jgi:hypothetical protein
MVASLRRYWICLVHVEAGFPIILCAFERAAITGVGGTPARQRAPRTEADRVAHRPFRELQGLLRLASYLNGH